MQWDYCGKIGIKITFSSNKFIKKCIKCIFHNISEIQKNIQTTQMSEIIDRRPSTKTFAERAKEKTVIAIYSWKYKRYWTSSRLRQRMLWFVVNFIPHADAHKLMKAMFPLLRMKVFLYLTVIITK